MKVLVTLDGSVLAECMLAPALRLAGEGGEIDLVRVLPTAPGKCPEKAMQEAGEAYLEEIRTRLEPEGVRVRWDLEGGDPAERILIIVKEREPDLIAMATHGASGAERAVRGSVAERILRESSVPVLLANPNSIPKTHEAFWKRILVPIDGSPLADGVLPYVEELAKRFDSDVVLFDVHPKRQPISLREQTGRLRDLGVRVTRHTTEGQAAEEILKAAKDADMVCMSTHGRSGLSRWWFGSVAEQVLRVCDRPMLIVRPPREG